MEKSKYNINDAGYYGEFGGAFIPEMLQKNVSVLLGSYLQIMDDPDFKAELRLLMTDYAGRPSPLYFAPRLSAHFQTNVYLKREDLNHTGSHKINNALGQILLAKRMGKTRIIAETGAGQHGVATATACALMGLECIVFMGKTDVERQFLNVQKMRMLGATVEPVTSGNHTLKDATNEAIRDWIGHPEENLAWDMIAQARGAAVSANPLVASALESGEPSPDVTAEMICRSLYAAEGSDWFWWYGDDHFSPHSDRFDRLFRQHLMNIYRLLGQDPPRELLEPIKKKNPAGLIREPAAFIDPEINGRISDYFEWLAAGLYDLTRQGSAMHSSDRMLQSFYYGYNKSSFFIRIDGVQDLSRLLKDDDVLNLHLIYDRDYRLPLQMRNDEGLLLVKENGVWTPTSSYCHWKIAKNCEISIPLSSIKLEAGSKLFVSVALVRDNEEVGRWPSDAPLMLYYAGEDIELDNWLI